MFCPVSSGAGCIAAIAVVSTLGANRIAQGVHEYITEKEQLSLLEKGIVQVGVSETAAKDIVSKVETGAAIVTVAAGGYAIIREVGKNGSILAISKTGDEFLEKYGSSVASGASKETSIAKNTRESLANGGRVETGIGNAAANIEQGMIQNNNSTRFITSVKVKDATTGKTIEGTVDLGPTLDRIKNSHKNDGSTYRNVEQSLPVKPKGYYKEYVVRTPGIDRVGPQRIVIGNKGEAYFTSDHYKTFIKIR